MHSIDLLIGGPVLNKDGGHAQTGSENVRYTSTITILFVDVYNKIFRIYLIRFNLFPSDVLARMVKFNCTFFASCRVLLLTTA